MHLCKAERSTREEYMKRVLILVFLYLLAITQSPVLAQVGHALDPTPRPFPYELAEPAPMPRAELPNVIATPSSPEPGPSFDWPGQPPRSPLRAEDRVRVFNPTLVTEIGAVSVLPAPNVGTAKGQFSSSRVIPLEALITYPWSTVGKIFLTTADGQQGVCSGAVIAPRIVLTAGHCVHSGKNGAAGYIESLEFHPGYYFGEAIGLWHASYVITTEAWMKGGNKVPNAADYALIELADNELGRVGDVVGWLGVLTKKLNPNHVTMLGYPVAFDSGEWMHQVSAQSLKNAPSNTVAYGSDMTQGSSGGPWIQNFGTPATGQTGGTNSAPNKVVGVMSYVSNKRGDFVAGSSILDQNFTTIFNLICRHQTGNCS
jgi:V8-like Glu-specific endopeptidase